MMSDDGPQVVSVVSAAARMGNEQVSLSVALDQRFEAAAQPGKIRGRRRQEVLYPAQGLDRRAAGAQIGNTRSSAVEQC